jgi:integrase
MRWNLPPLTEYPVKSRRVGWKYPLLSSDQQYLDVFWSDLAAGSLFHQLWLEYLMRRPRTDHPWAFISQDLNPMSTTNFQHRHAAACRRIGLLPAKHRGTTPHGHRHAYAQQLKTKGTPRDVIQAAMHHTSILSQEIYKRSSFADLVKAIAVPQGSGTLLPSAADLLT